MLSLIPARQVQFDPDLLERNQYEPHVHRSLIATPLRENEFVILKMVQMQMIGIVRKLLKYYPLM